AGFCLFGLIVIFFALAYGPRKKKHLGGKLNANKRPARNNEGWKCREEELRGAKKRGGKKGIRSFPAGNTQSPFIPGPAKVSSGYSKQMAFKREFLGS
ncbi:MAG: hypothetical protein L7F78_23665, partial [Syntrophales bacterium LBB04]|nr:hypothetical protein [Syntrophales bacterium LBB04]